MSLNLIKKVEASTIGHTYGFFPHDDIRFEMEFPEANKHWGFFANKSNRTQIHIKYDPQKLEHDF